MKTEKKPTTEKKRQRSRPEDYPQVIAGYKRMIKFRRQRMKPVNNRVM